MHCQAISRSSVEFEAPVIGHWSGSFKIRARIIGLPVPLDLALHCAAAERRPAGLGHQGRLRENTANAALPELTMSRERQSDCNCPKDDVHWRAGLRDSLH